MSFITPMLLEKTDQPFYDTNYIFEPKMDGIRLLVSKVGDQTRMWTRHKNEITQRFPELLDVPVDTDVILDGELVCVDPETGSIDFELIMERFSAKKSDKIKILQKQLPVEYVVFDILHYDRTDLRSIPLLERKAILDEVMHENAFYKKISYIEDRGTDLFAAVEQMKLEGMVCKYKNSKYVSKRSKHWLKLINWMYEDVYITGYRKDEFGWVCSRKEGENFRPIGTLELGTTPQVRQAFYAISKQLITREDDKLVELEPVIRCRLKFRNYTRKGLLRTPSFVKFLY